MEWIKTSEVNEYESFMQGDTDPDTFLRIRKLGTNWWGIHKVWSNGREDYTGCYDTTLESAKERAETYATEGWAAANNFVKLLHGQE
jgi:hypothetical protein